MGIEMSVICMMCDILCVCVCVKSICNKIKIVFSSCCSASMVPVRSMLSILQIHTHTHTHTPETHTHETQNPKQKQQITARKQFNWISFNVSAVIDGVYYFCIVRSAMRCECENDKPNKLHGIAILKSSVQCTTDVYCRCRRCRRCHRRHHPSGVVCA